MARAASRAVVDPESVRHVSGRWVNATGDICAGDVVRYKEVVWRQPYLSGGRGSRWPDGWRTVTALVLRDSYGELKQQHTFTLKVVACTGDDALEAGSVIRRKGRNVYRFGTERLLWEDERLRKAVLDEKHRRGDKARAKARERRAGEYAEFWDAI